MADPGAWRDRFAVPDPDLVYLDGNSLGRPPRAAFETAEATMARWSERLIGGWNDGWYELPLTVGDKIGQLLGARPGEVVVADSTTINLHKLATAALRARPGPIVTDDLNFPSDHHALAAIAEREGVELRVVSSDGLHGPVEGIREALSGAGLLSLSATAFHSGYTYDLGALTAAAHDAGAQVLWDLSHTAGSVPVDFTAAEVDLAVGCSYKYLNGGPGAPAWSFVRSDLQAELANPLPGWMGQSDPFTFDPHHRPAEGMRRFLTGTPPVLSLALVEAGVDLLLQAGMDELREASLALTDRIVDWFDEELAPRGMGLASPRDHSVRGGHITVTHPHGLAVDLALIDAGVVPDFRPPDGIRLGPAALYTTLGDVDRAMERLVAILDEERWRPFAERAVVVT